MGYDIHITRRVEWYDEDDIGISRGEFIQLVDGRDELSIVDQDSADLMAIRDGDETQWLMWDSSGDVLSKNPSQEMIAWMYEIAQLLGAKVQGDEGEIYRSGGQADMTKQQTRDSMPQQVGFFKRLFGKC